MTGPDREHVENARGDLYERLFGPLPDTASALQNLMGVWPGGRLLQIEGRQVAGLTATVSDGLTNPGLPPGVRVESQDSREEHDARFIRREQTTQLTPAPARHVTPGLAGYGYELVVLTPRPQRWPLQFMNWAVPAEMLHDIRFLDGVMEHGGLTIEDVGLGDDASCDFLIAPARHLLPAEHMLPNGRMHLLVVTAITREQMEYGRRHGCPALLKRLLDEGPGQVSLYEGPPAEPTAPEPDNWVSYEDQAPSGYAPSGWRDDPEQVQRADEARLRQLAGAGDIEAACALGVRLAGTGRMEEWDQRQAEAGRWLRMAAERGHGWAAFQLAALLMETNSDEAAYWDDQARERGIG
jgi:hypothetical protein